MKTIVMLTACAVMTAGAELVQVGTDPLDGMPMMAEKREKALDGVNEIITYADGQQAMTTVLPLNYPEPVRKAFVFRGEVRDGRTFIVGVDGERREAILVDPLDYAMLTNKIEASWRLANSTEENRLKVHGKRVNQQIEDGEKSTTYEDGYKYYERIPVKKRPPHSPQEIARAKERIEKRKATPRGSARYRDFKRLLEERKRAKTKEVNVEYNAVNGETKEVK